MNFLRGVISGSRNRYRDGEFDLDLSYVTPRLIAMAYPATGAEAMYRNNIAEVSRFLNKKHGANYMVFNLSERPYDTAYFDHRVMPLGFPDHHAPPVEVAWTVCRTMHGWLSAAPENVAVVHCLAGKGRTGVIIACYMLFTGQTLPPPLLLPTTVWDAEVLAATTCDAAAAKGLPVAAGSVGGVHKGVCIARTPQALGGAGLSAPDPAAAGHGAAPLSPTRAAKARPLQPIATGWSPATSVAHRALDFAEAATAAPVLARSGQVALGTSAAHAGKAATNGHPSAASTLRGSASVPLVPAPASVLLGPPIGPRTTHTVTVGSAVAAATAAAAGSRAVATWATSSSASIPSVADVPVAALDSTHAPSLREAASDRVMAGFSVVNARDAKAAAQAAAPASASSHSWLQLPPPSVSAQDTLAIFRCQRGQGVKYASQERTVRYFALVMHHAIVAEHCAMLRAEAGIAEPTLTYQRPSAPGTPASASGSESEDTDPSIARLQAYLACLMSDAPYSAQPLLVRAEAAANLTRMRRLPLPPRVPLHALRVVLPRIPLIPGGFVPQLQIMAAPYQGGTQRVFYNSSWQSPTPAVYGPSDGPAIFKTDAQLQGDILVVCRQMPAGPLLFSFSFHTAFVRHDCEADAAATSAPAAAGSRPAPSIGAGVYRLRLPALDIERRKAVEALFPPDFSVDLCFKEVTPADAPIVVRARGLPGHGDAPPGSAGLLVPLPLMPAADIVGPPLRGHPHGAQADSALAVEGRGRGAVQTPSEPPQQQQGLAGGSAFEDAPPYRPQTAQQRMQYMLGGASAADLLAASFFGGGDAGPAPATPPEAGAALTGRARSASTSILPRAGGTALSIQPVAMSGEGGGVERGGRGSGDPRSKRGSLADGAASPWAASPLHTLDALDVSSSPAARRGAFPIDSDPSPAVPRRAGSSSSRSRRRDPAAAPDRRGDAAIGDAVGVADDGASDAGFDPPSPDEPAGGASLGLWRGGSAAAAAASARSRSSGDLESEAAAAAGASSGSARGPASRGARRGASGGAPPLAPSPAPPRPALPPATVSLSGSGVVGLPGEGVVRMGYLVKQATGLVVHNWRRRWCVLRSLLPTPAPAAAAAAAAAASPPQAPPTRSGSRSGSRHGTPPSCEAEDDGGEDAADDSPWAATGAPFPGSAASGRRSRGSSAGSLAAAGPVPRDATVACLDYYVKSGDAAPRGVVTLTAAALSSASIVQRGSAAAAKVEGRPRVLEVMSGGRPFFAQALTDEDARAWLAAFHELGALATAQLGLS